jgi:hypothetical protein
MIHHRGHDYFGPIFFPHDLLYHMVTANGIDAIIKNAAVLSLVKVMVFSVCASPDLMQQLGVKIEDVSENEYLSHHQKNNPCIVRYQYLFIIYYIYC